MAGPTRQAGRERKAKRLLERKAARRALSQEQRLDRRIQAQRLARQDAQADRDRAKARKITKVRRQLQLDRKTTWALALPVRYPEERLQGLVGHWRRLVNPKDQSKADHLLKHLLDDGAARVQLRAPVYFDIYFQAANGKRPSSERVTFADLLVTYRTGQQVAVLGPLEQRDPADLEAVTRFLTRRGIRVLIVPYRATEGLAALVTHTRRAGNLGVTQNDQMGRLTNRHPEPRPGFEHLRRGSGNQDPASAQGGGADSRHSRPPTTRTPRVRSYVGTSSSLATAAHPRGPVSNPHSSCSGQRPGNGGTAKRRGLRRRPGFRWAFAAHGLLWMKNPPEFLSNAWWKLQRTRIPASPASDWGRELHTQHAKLESDILRVVAPQAHRNRKKLLRQAMKLRVKGQVAEALHLERRAWRTTQRAFSSPAKLQELRALVG